MAFLQEKIQPIQQISLADAVCERIRQAIITGQLVPGERLSEPALSTQLAVSRSPVREALQRLQLEGLVVGQTNRTCTVWDPTEADVKEILSLRVMIENLAAECCIDTLTDEDLQKMEEMTVLQRQAIETEDYISLIREDKLFHEYICARANHRRLLDWWHQIMGQWEVLIYRRLLANPEHVIPTVLRDHAALIEALRSRDLQRVEHLHREINHRVMESTAAALAK